MARPTDAPGPGPVVACWGTFDVANYGDLLFPRVFERELLARLPHATVAAYAPLGSGRPLAMDGGYASLPLGDRSPATCAWLAHRHDLIAIGGGEILHTRDDVYRHYYGVGGDRAGEFAPSLYFIEGLGELERTVPVALHSVGVPLEFDERERARVRAALETKAYVAVRDEVSRARLLATGTEREIHVVPDSALLLPRLFPPDLLRRRLRHLRAIDAYPSTEAPLVVHGSGWIADRADEIGDALAAALVDSRVPVVVAEIGPCHGDEGFADRLAARLGGAAYRVRGDVAVEDVAAAIAHARAYAGLSLHGALTAHAFDVPAVVLNLAGYSKLDGYARLSGQEEFLVTEPARLADVLRRALALPGPSLEPATKDAMIRAVDEHFDRLASLAESSWASRTTETVASLARELSEERRRHAALRRAYEARGERLLSERIALAEQIEALRSAAADPEPELRELRGSREHLELVDAELAEARRELEALRGERDELRRRLDDGR